MRIAFTAISCKNYSYAHQNQNVIFKKKSFVKNLHVQKQHSRVGTFPPLTNRGRGNAGGAPGGIKLLSWHLRFTSSLKTIDKSLARSSTWKVQPAGCARPKHVHPAELVQSHGQPGEVAHLVGGVVEMRGCGEVRIMMSLGDWARWRTSLEDCGSHDESQWIERLAVYRDVDGEG